MLGGIQRRFFLKILAATGIVASSDVVAGCSSGADDSASGDDALTELSGYEYIIVGSGAGGGPLAANLARAGRKVLLLEAGDDQGANLNQEVPAFHTRSSEDPTMCWDYFVKHYEDPQRQQQDSKFTWKTPDGKFHVGPNAPAGSKPLGILYPRAGTLGGCTTHNAMVTVYPHESDWKKISNMLAQSSDATDKAEAASWEPEAMRKYYEILERCEYLKTSDSTAGHGTKGWLGVTRADAKVAGLDLQLIEIIKAGASAIAGSVWQDLTSLYNLISADLNAPGPDRDAKEAIYQIPLAINEGKRNGPRDYLMSVANAKRTDGSKMYPLDIRTGCLATRVLFDDAPGADGKLKAIGIEFLDGKHLYRADPNPTSDQGQVGRAFASREVILAAGAYNTPQLLKLSGIGPSDELGKFQIVPRTKNGSALHVLDRKGVGTNLQDRYEIGVASTVKDDFSSLNGCTFGNTANDPCLVDWKQGKGVYTTNGAPIGIIKKSSSVGPGEDPDLFIFGGPAIFRGYFPGYSQFAVADKKRFTWAILKGHTRNRSGTVKLTSSDPRAVPDITFNSFDTGTNGNGEADLDLEAVADGVDFCRQIGQIARDSMFSWVPLVGGKFNEETPGTALSSRDQVKEFIKNEAWGHHASCTCPMGTASDDMAVLDGRFRVRGTSGLRVVDASVFPQIPGFFIVVPIYMISEKATDVILADAGFTRAA